MSSVCSSRSSFSRSPICAAVAASAPPPLLAEYQDGRLLLQDGNHRYEALVRAGETHAWVLVWFDNPEDRDAYRNRARATG